MARGAGIGAAAGAGVAILASMMQPKGSNSDVDLASGSIFETKLDRPITISNPKLLASNVPTSSTPPSTPGANATTASTVVEVSTPDRSTSTDARPEESVLQHGAHVRAAIGRSIHVFSELHSVC